MSSNERNCCLFVPLKTGVYIITAIGILNKLSGFYGLASFEYQDCVAVAAHIYSIISLIIFSFGLYGISKDNRTLLKFYAISYWIDLLISTLMTVYFAIQWFEYTDHSLPELADDPQKKKEHDDVFKIESIVSVIILCFIRFTQIYFAYLVTHYYKSLSKTQYSKITAQVDEDLSFAEYKEMV
ncbi:unnamed protein product [Rhizopus stolonifer]